MVSKAADAGNGRGMNGVGYLYNNGFCVPVDLDKAREWYQKGAAAGNDYAMFNLALMYRDDEDISASNEWFRKAADAGNTDAMFELGNNYQFDYASDTDNRSALNWYMEAAKAGHAGAMNNIGILYFQGVLVEQNYTTAMTGTRKLQRLAVPGPCSISATSTRKALAYQRMIALHEPGTKKLLIAMMKK